MKAIGITCGIGSLLVGAREAGFEVLTNIEWRDYYRTTDDMGRNTYSTNFGAPIVPSLDGLPLEEIERLMNADLAMGHPECGRYSQLSGSVKNREQRALDPADIPLFVGMVARLKPRYFVMDDLPKSFPAYPMEKYAEALPEYDLFPEWVSNWGYGNVQKGRNRMFMIGSLKKEHWVFIPGEAAHNLQVKDVIGDLPEPRAGLNTPNHEPFDLELDCLRALNMGGYRKKNSWRAVKEYFADKGGGYTLDYERIDGSVVKRIGFLKGHWEGPSHVLTGGNAILHHLRNEPYTIRERARIQGFPDDFIFYSTKLNDRGEWNHDLNMHMVKQTGKAMPVQFATYVAKQIAAQIRGNHFKAPPGERVLDPNPFVDEAKSWYCENVGYANQQRACSACWLYDQCAIRTPKYGIGPVPAPRRVLRNRNEINGVIPTGGPESQDSSAAYTRREETPVSPRPRQRTPSPVRVMEPVETKIMDFGKGE